MDAARRGDRAAFGRLVARHRAWVTGLLAGIVEDADAAQDLAQEIFSRLFANPGSYAAQGGRFVPWLKTVAVNAGRNFLRGRRRRRAVPLPDAWEETEAGGEEQRRLDPQTVAESRLLTGQLRSALAALSDEQREAVTLHYFGGRSVEEIAAALGCPPGTVKSRLFHARKRLRETLGGETAD